jgi:hypothetical protein
VDSRAVSAVALPIDEGGCSDVLLVPDDDVAVIDVDVYDGEGRLVARAKESGPVRSVTVCSPVLVNGSLQVRPHVGRGLVAVVVSKTKANSARELLLRPEIVWVAPQASLDAARGTRDAALAKVGYPPPSTTKSGQLELGRRVTWPLELSKGAACTRVDVLAGAPLAYVDAAVWDDSGAALAAGDGSVDVTLFACGKGHARLDLGTTGRSGPVAVLARPERWFDPVFMSYPLAAGRMLGRASTGTPAQHEGTTAAVRYVSLDNAKLSVQRATIPSGHCLRMAVGAEGAGTGLVARLFDDGTGEEIDRAHAANATVLRGCAGADARAVRLELRATAGKLDAIVGERLLPP